MHETGNKVIRESRLLCYADWEIEYGGYYFDEMFTIDNNIALKDGRGLFKPK